MKKKKGIKSIYIILLFLVFVFGSAIFFATQQTGIQQNFNVFSIDSPIITSTNPNLQNFDFLIYGSFGGGNRIIGEISPTRTDYTGKKPITFSANGIQETAVYSIIRNQQEALYKLAYHYEMQPTGIGGIPYGVPNSCPSDFFELGFEDNQYPIRDVRHCMKFIHVGWSGILQNPSVKFKANVILSNGDEEIPRTISSDDRVVAFDDIAIMNIEGALITGDALPIVKEEVKPILFNNGNWYFISRDNYNRYLNTMDNDVATETWNVLLDEGNKILESDEWIKLMEARVKDINRKVDTTLDSEITFAGTTWKDRTTLDNARIESPLDVVFSKQTFTLKVRADWVGIELLSSEPEITRLSCPEFKSADGGKIEVTIRNEGNSEAKFYTKVYDCSPINQVNSAESESVYLDAGDDEKIIVELETGNINADVSETCKVKVYDSQDPSAFDEETVTCTVKKVDLCTNGNEVINGIKPYCVDKCVDGEIIEEYFCCDETTEKLKYVGDGYDCVPKEGGSGGGGGGGSGDCDPLINIKNPLDESKSLFKIDNPFCDLKDKFYLIAGIVGILFAISAFILGKTNFYDNKSKKKRHGFDLVLIGIFAVLVGLMVFIILQMFIDFFFSFWGILTIILVFVVLIFINKIKGALGFK